MKNNDCIDYFKQNGIAVLIPTYNNAGTLGQVIESVLEYCDDLIVVNDGSNDETQLLLTNYPHVKVACYSPNKGKGYALRTGFRLAKKLGFKSVITMDSDGQHLASDLPLIADENMKNLDSIIVGSRSFNVPNMPQKNSFANRFSNFWFTVQTAISLPDTQTGYRLYPLEVMGGMTPINNRYEAELELLVRCAWKNIPIVSRAIHVYYPPKEERVSHFRPGMDFLRISLLNTLLCVLALIYGYPSMLIRKLLGIKGCKK